MNALFVTVLFYVPALCTYLDPHLGFVVTTVFVALHFNYRPFIQALVAADRATYNL